MTDSECPNCGTDVPPDVEVRCAEKIVFYNCPECDYSTWEKAYFESWETHDD